MSAEKINGNAASNRTDAMALPDNFAVGGASRQGLPRSARSWSMLTLLLIVSGAWYGYATTTVVGWGANSYSGLDIPPDLTNVVTIASGNYHTLALRRDGTVVSWGSNNNGETNVPPWLSNVVTVAAGTWHSMALQADGNVVVWGRNNSGQTNVPSWLSNVVAIAAGSTHCVALRADGQVFAWGSNSSGQTNVPAGLSNVVDIVARSTANLALKSDGSLVPWGIDNYPNPMMVPAAATNVMAISSGGGHHLVLRADGKVVAWGVNNAGQTNVPANLSNVVAIAAGRSHSLALKADGELVAWGDNSAGQSAIPTGISNIVALSGGTVFSMVVISDGEHEPPQIFQVTSPGHAWSGYPVRLECWAAGGGPLFYQWHFENTLIPDATNAVLELANVQITNTGIYRVMVSNRWGFAAQRQTRLTVEEGPLYLLSQPTNVTGLFGQHLSLQPLLTGSRPDCQWFFNDQLLTNATQAELVFPHLDFTHSGEYSFILSNQFGMVTGTPIALTVYPVLAWGTNTYGQTNLPHALANNSNVVAVSAGDSHNLALLADGTVLGWGNNSAGQATPPPGLSNVVAIAVGSGHSLALTVDGRVMAWGDNTAGQTNVPDGLAEVIAISAGKSHNLALRWDGTVVAWGANNEGQRDVPEGLANVIAVAAGGWHSLALLADGTVTSWGNYYSYLSYHAPATVPDGLSNVVAISAGEYHDVAIKSDSTVVAWGLSGLNRTNVPPGLSNVIQIAASYSSTLALKADGTLTAWGWNSAGQTNVPAQLGKIMSIAGSGQHYLVLAHVSTAEQPYQSLSLSADLYSGEQVHWSIQPPVQGPLTWQWQFNSQDLPGATNNSLALLNVQMTQSGAYAVTARNDAGWQFQAQIQLTVTDSPPIVASQPPAQVGVHYGYSTTLVVRAEGSLPLTYQWWRDGQPIPNATSPALELPELRFPQAGAYALMISNRFGAIWADAIQVQPLWAVAWGGNNYGQLQIPGELVGYTQIAAGPYHNLALRPDGTVVAWGAGGYGQTNVPPGLSNVVAVSAGGSHSLALKSDGTVAAWGVWWVPGGIQEITTPPQLTNVVEIAASGDFDLALKADGSVGIWYRVAPNFLNKWWGLTNAVAIAAGYKHGLALTADGRVFAREDNSYGQTNVPSGLSNVVAIAAGGLHSLALQADGTVVAWGANDYGQTNVPPGLSNVVAIAAGAFHSLALQKDGILIAWGDNSNGQTILPSGLTQFTAISGGEYHSLGLINPICPQPIIFTPGPGPRVYSGETVLYRAWEGTSGDVYYQWQFNGANLAGATNTTLVLPDVQADHSGTYALVVRNALGMTNRREISLEVSNKPPQLLDLPQSWQGYASQALVLKARGDGSVPLHYQWFYDGTPLPQATNTDLIFSSVHSAQSGEYVVMLSNRFGVTTSAPVQVQVSTPSILGVGYNAYGQCDTPTNLTDIADLAAGSFHSLALLANGTVVAWGDNSRSQINVPSDLVNVVAIAAGYWHNLALKANGTVVQWGEGPQMPSGLTNVIAVAADAEFSAALLADGTLRIWGYYEPFNTTNVVALAGGDYHTLVLTASGTIEDWFILEGSFSPVGFTNIIAIAAGVEHSLALDHQGKVAAWSPTPFGQVNISTLLSNVVAIAAGNYFSLALTSAGQVVGWGSNEYGQLDIPTGLKNVRKIAAGAYHTLLLLGDDPQWRGRIAKTGNGPTTEVRLTVPVWGRATVKSTTDLRIWTLWLEITNTFGPVELPLPVDQSRRFLRWSK